MVGLTGSKYDFVHSALVDGVALKIVNALLNNQVADFTSPDIVQGEWG
ncbi:hypothetical protein N9381_00255 [Paracoccaceae bacterium]|nr:hypothetical protein [Paracoccaceae bacterium]